MVTDDCNLFSPAGTEASTAAKSASNERVELLKNDVIINKE